MLEITRPDIPPPWDALLGRGLAYLREHDGLKGARAAVLIGSVAEQTAEPGSDLDLVLIVDEKLPWQLAAELLGWTPRFQVVDLTAGELQKHFDRNSIMAWSIRRGQLLADPQGIVRAQLARPGGPPSREWLQELWQHMWWDYLFGLTDWRRARKEHRELCARECWGHTGIFLARATVNFALIWSCLRGELPTTKAALRQALQRLCVAGRVLDCWETAVRIRREDREAPPDDIRKVGVAALWFSAALQPVLGRPHRPRPARKP